MREIDGFDCVASLKKHRLLEQLYSLETRQERCEFIRTNSLPRP
jgi:hypothetical protein